MKKKNKVGRISLPNFKTDYIGTIIKTTQYWHRGRHIDQWNRIKNSEIVSNHILNCFFSKMQRQSNEGKITFSINDARMSALLQVFKK